MGESAFVEVKKDALKIALEFLSSSQVTLNGSQARAMVYCQGELTRALKASVPLSAVSEQGNEGDVPEGA